MTNYFKHSKENPFHLSVGGVALNSQGEVLVHFWPHMDVKDLMAVGDNVYLLMRETVEMGETLEQALNRGFMEEFGAIVEIERYIGSITSRPPQAGGNFEKTTLYFLCKFLSMDAGKRAVNDPEGGSIPMFKKIQELIPAMQTQGQQMQRDDLDESKILNSL